MRHLRLLLFAALLASCAGPPRSADDNHVAAPERPSVSGMPSPGASVDPATIPPANAPRSGEPISKPGSVDFKQGLPLGWTQVNAGNGAGWKFLPDRAEIVVPPDRNFTASAQDAPRIERVVEGDFEIRARVGLEAVAESNAVGLFVLRNDATFVRFELGFEGGQSVVVRSAEEGTFETVAAVGVAGKAIELLLRRNGAVIETFWREPGALRWQKAGRTTTGYPKAVVVGFFGASGDATMTAFFSDVNLAPLSESVN